MPHSPTALSFSFKTLRNICHDLITMLMRIKYTTLSPLCMGEKAVDGFPFVAPIHPSPTLQPPSPFSTHSLYLPPHRSPLSTISSSLPLSMHTPFTLSMCMENHQTPMSTAHSQPFLLCHLGQGKFWQYRLGRDHHFLKLQCPPLMGYVIYLVDWAMSWHAITQFRRL